MNLLDIDITGYDTLLLDRDGVINRLRPNDYVKCWEEFEFLPGVFEALKKWTPIVKHIFVVTNQRGVGKGVMSENDYRSSNASFFLSENDCRNRKSWGKNRWYLLLYSTIRKRYTKEAGLWNVSGYIA